MNPASRKLLRKGANFLITITSKLAVGLRYVLSGLNYISPFITAFATALLVLVAIWQWSELHNTDKTLRDTLNAQIDATQRQLRAYVHIRSGKIQTTLRGTAIDVSVDPVIKVYGQTPAGAVTAQWTLAVLDWPLNEKSRLPNYLTAPGTGLLSNVSNAPGEEEPLGAKTISLSKDQIDSIVVSGSRRLVAIGTILYIDVFRLPRYTNFCFGLDESGIKTGVAVRCAIHNGADWNNQNDPYQSKILNVPML
jgi:hypothetical protein